MAARLLLGALLALNINLALAETISDDGGGQIGTYATRAADYRTSGETVRFTGRCDSACTLYLALPKTCILPGASFGFHLPYGESPKNLAIAKAHLWRNYPGWVKSWINAHGGLSADIKRMPYSVAARHIQACN